MSEIIFTSVYNHVTDATDRTASFRTSPQPMHSLTPSLHKITTMELSTARRLMVVSRMKYFLQKHEVAVANLTNPNVCLHAGSFIRYSDACRFFVVIKLKQLHRERQSRRNSDDAVILRTELANSRSFYQTLLRKRRSVEPVQRQPVQRQRRSIERLRGQSRAAARGRRDVFMNKAAEHQRRFLLRRQQIE